LNIGLGVGRLVVGGFFAVAAVAKALNPIAFSAVIGHVLGGLGVKADAAMVTRPIALGLIVLEAVLAVVFLLGLDGRRWRVATLAVLTAFSGVLVWMWFYPSPKGCGCLGFFRDGHNPSREALLGLVRNAGLMLCVAGLMTPGAGGDARSGGPAGPAAGRAVAGAGASPGGPPGGVRGGFTLVEVLVAVSIVGLLVSLALPALLGSRERGWRTRELAQVRSIGAASVAYAGDYQDHFPTITSAGRLGGEVPFAKPGYSIAYFTGHSELYINVLVPTYVGSAEGLTYDTPEFTPAMEFPRQRVRSLVHMSYTAFAQPGYFVGREPPANPTPLLRTAVWSQVAFPGEKGLLLDLRAAGRERRRGVAHAGKLEPWLIGWCDGSAAERGVNVRTPYRVVSRRTMRVASPVMATEGGVAGRDFELAAGGSQGPWSPLSPTMPQTKPPLDPQP
jgi:prepilin-type N-terminal cleavage/methylation domain-containing protein